MFDNILVVCVGNICRSPALERLLREGLPTKQVHSAGLGALVGKPIDSTMERLMVADGVDASHHAARQLDARILREADVVLVMESGHLTTIRNRYPEAAGKTMLATHWNGGDAVADPYRKDPEFFAACYRQLKECSASWLEKLS